MTVGFIGRHAKIAIGFVRGKYSSNTWIYQVIQIIGSNAIKFSEQTTT